MVLTPSFGSNKSDILAVTRSEPRLIVLPKWIVSPDRLHPGWVGKAGQYEADAIARRLLTPLAPSTTLVRRAKSYSTPRSKKAVASTIT